MASDQQHPLNYGDFPEHYVNSEFNIFSLRYIKTIQKGDLCIGPAVTWLQEKGESFFDEMTDTQSDQQATDEAKNYKCARLWIYSHHIYSKVCVCVYVRKITQVSILM